MAEARQTRWWRKTCWLAASVVVLWAFFGVVIQVFDASFVDVDAFGFPLGYFLAVAAAPILMAVILFSFVERQKIIDRRNGASESP
jgi:putative solute:sodium symporter small subunit